MPADIDVLTTECTSVFMLVLNKIPSKLIWPWFDAPWGWDNGKHDGVQKLSLDTSSSPRNDWTSYENEQGEEKEQQQEEEEQQQQQQQ